MAKSGEFEMTRILILAGLMGSLAACGGEIGPDKVVDGQTIGRSDLVDLQAGIWVDPSGCEHWIIDDGIEGYLSQRLQRNGLPVCGPTAPPTYATGPFRGGQDINDAL